METTLHTRKKLLAVSLSPPMILELILAPCTLCSTTRHGDNVDGLADGVEQMVSFIRYPVGGGTGHVLSLALEVN